MSFITPRSALGSSFSIGGSASADSPSFARSSANAVGTGSFISTPIDEVEVEPGNVVDGDVGEDGVAATAPFSGGPFSAGLFSGGAFSTGAFSAAGSFTGAFSAGPFSVVLADPGELGSLDRTL
jgi:hypothetical protein